MKFAVLLLSYLLGSIPVGYIVCKLGKGINIMEHGSGNIGFTNVLRVAGPLYGAVVLLGDTGKGMLAAYLGLKYGIQWGILGGIAAMLGHSFSIFLKLRGGKLVATGLGVLIILAPKVALTALVVWLITLAFTRYVSLSSILAGISVPIAMLAYQEPLPMVVFGAFAAGFVVIRHKSNIRKLMAGQEYKIGQKVDPK
ncbi:glycerol-3-phosphate 1-O-acyltransferase PlsY [Thermincola potens]|uniref:Glycerol-3-phosphate acyltransferase n=1 Tax=Thermincola potens (strain JR) TaxID=635013 RepID=D5XFL2_THEPJ|nr:glycerol-3-phosphate 1-O-acyltransferase PlsY [Thermincola potens]ADG82433.1 protein of unknown function DUF205 [Thermincola potens JR]